MKTAKEINETLPHFYGSQEYHRFSPLFPKLILTDGAKYLADAAQCYWLMDIIGSIMHKIIHESFVSINLIKNKRGNGAKFTADDGNGKILYKQNIPYTDFPLQSIRLYANIADHDGTRIVMLTTEY